MDTEGAGTGRLPVHLPPASPGVWGQLTRDRSVRGRAADSLAFLLLVGKGASHSPVAEGHVG